MKSDKTMSLDGVGVVVIAKSGKARHIKAWIAQDGQARVTIPKWMSYKVGSDFAHKHRSWFIKHKTTQPKLTDGSIIGRDHTIRYENTKSRLENKTIFIDSNLPVEKQKISEQKFIEKSLRSQTKELIDPRVEFWQSAMGLKAKQIKYRKMTSRWGSCSTKKSITFSIYSSQLDDDLIDYIVVHELAHLKQMNHSKKYWDLVAKFIPDHKDKRKRLKVHRLSLQPK